MTLTSVILVVDKYFEDQEIILENVANANSSLELLIYNNCGEVLPELKDIASKYMESHPMIEMGYADCVNNLLPYCSGDYICILYDYGYMFDNWLLNIIKSYQQIVNSGVISVNYNYTAETNFFLNTSDQMEWKYFENNVVSGMMFFSKELLLTLGGLNNKLHGKYLFYEYCYRAGSIGKYNYYDTDNSIIAVDCYSSNYLTTKHEYKLALKDCRVFKILKGEKYFNSLIQELKKYGIEASYSKRLDCAYIVANEFKEDQINTIMTICLQLKFSYEFICTGYYENYLWKGRVSVILKKVL